MPPVVRKTPVLRQARFSFLQLEKHRVAASPVRRKQALLQLSCPERESAIAWESERFQTAPPATNTNAKPLRCASPPAFGDHPPAVARPQDRIARAFRRHVTSCRAKTPASTFFPQTSAAIGGLYRPRPRICVSYSGNDMKPASIRLPKNVLFQDDAARPDLEALETAKARQDESHQKLDKFIAAALAELSGKDRPA
jgi:hypothetical protein